MFVLFSENHFSGFSFFSLYKKSPANAHKPQVIECRSKSSFIRNWSHDIAIYSSCWSPRLARSHYCQQLTGCLSGCLSVCLSRSFKLLLLFCFWVESSHFWPSVLLLALYKTLFFDFWFKPPNAQNLLPKICTKSPTTISRFVWQIDRRCLGQPGGFRGWPIQWNHAKCCRADPCCHGNEIWARRRDTTHRRRNLTRQLSRVGVGGAYWA